MKIHKHVLAARPRLGKVAAKRVLKPIGREERRLRPPGITKKLA